MDFFQSQDVARRKTGVLVLYFALAVVLIIAAVYGAIILMLLWADVPHNQVFKRDLFAWICGITLVIVLGGSLYKMLALRGGGEAVALSLGGRQIDPGSCDSHERRLLNVVEEMAIAAGLPVPPVYVMPEDGINAFAAGYAPTDAVIGVTRGTIQRLSRDELQGVIAHEFSHILNGDMRLNIRLMGFIFGILCLVVIGRVLLRTRGKKNPLPMLGLALILIGSAGAFFGRLIKSAVSRQREFLADAAAVQFTRNPDGIGGALKKIGGLTAGSQLATPNAAEASHMFFANGLKSSLFELMATHPPLIERIRRIDPGFDGAYPPFTPIVVESPAGPPPIPPPRTPGTPPRMPATLAVVGLMANVGAPQAAHVAYAADVLAALPPDLHQAAHDPVGARALLYGLISAADPAVRDQQLRALADGLDPEAAAALHPLLAPIRALPRTVRLPLVDLSFTGLRRMSREQYDIFCAALLKVIEADADIDLFEFALQQMIVRHLDPHFGLRPKRVMNTATLPQVLDATVDLLSTLAYYGHDDTAAAERAFQVGFAQLQSGAHRGIRPLADCGVTLVGAALDQAARAYPLVKRRVLQGCVAVVTSDQQVRIEEAELLRAIADALGCPVPPLLPEA